MTATRLIKFLCGAALGAFCTAGLAQAEEIQRDSMPADVWKRFAEHQKALESLDDSEAAKGVYSTIVLWPPTYPTLRVCFFGGSPELRAKIAQVAKEWESPNFGIKLDFGDANSPRSCGEGGRDNQIRVGFDKLGFWSQLGQIAVVYYKQEEASMNFEGFDKKPVDQLTDYEIGTIRHEFGHALGFFHEHQSPDAHCDAEYNWDFVYQYLSGPPNNWPKDQIDFNLKPIDTSQVAGVMLSDFDNTSVMLYVFPDKFYHKGASSRCFIPAPNNRISQVDHAVAEYMYPAAAQSRMESFEKNKAAFSAIWTKATDEGKKGVMVDMIKSFFESPGTANQ